MGYSFQVKITGPLHFTFAYVTADEGWSEEAEAKMWKAVGDLLAQYPEEVPLIVTEMWGPNSILVDPTSDLAALKRSIISRLREVGYTVADTPWINTPHVNLRGSPPNVLAGLMVRIRPPTEGKEREE